MPRPAEPRRLDVPLWLAAALPLGIATVLGAIVLTVFPGARTEITIESATPEPTAFGAARLPPSARAATPVATAHPSARTHMAWAASGGTVYLAGGLVEGRRTKSVIAFDGQAWRDLPSLPDFRFGAALGVLADGTLVLAGGETDGEPLDSMLLLPPGSSQWSLGPALPHGQAFGAYAVESDRLYIFGGAHEGASASVLAFDAATGTWSSHAALPLAVRSASAAAHDGAVYLTGGIGIDGQPRADTFRYDFAGDFWIRLTDAPAAIHTHASAVSNGRLWLIGTRNVVDARSGEIPVYDIASDVWTLADAGTSFANEEGLAALTQANGQLTVVGGRGAVVTVRTSP